MEALCFMISSILQVLFVRRVYQEYKGKTENTLQKIIYLVATYIIAYLIVFLPYVLSGVLETIVSKNNLIAVILSVSQEIMVLLSIFLSNKITKLMFRIFSIKFVEDSDKHHKNIMCGFLYSIFGISILAWEFNISIAILLYFIGSHVDFSFDKEKTFAKDDFICRLKIGIPITFFVFLLYWFENIFNVYEIWFLLPWLISIAGSILLIILMKIRKSITKI